MLNAIEAALEHFGCPSCFAKPKEPCSNRAPRPHSRRLGRGEGWVAARAELARVQMELNAVSADRASMVSKLSIERGNTDLMAAKIGRQMREIRNLRRLPEAHLVPVEPVSGP